MQARTQIRMLRDHLLKIYHLVPLKMKAHLNKKAKIKVLSHLFLLETNKDHCDQVALPIVPHLLLLETKRDHPDQEALEETDHLILSKDYLTGDFDFDDRYDSSSLSFKVPKSYRSQTSVYQ